MTQLSPLLQTRISRWTIPGLALASLLLSLGMISCAKQEAPKIEQRTFASPEAAVQALFEAAQSGDRGALLAVYGPDGEDIISSGDEVQDKNNRELVLAKYQQMHRLGRGPDGKMILYIGAENWPFPVPIVAKDGVWSFDTEAGRDAVLARRIGGNELGAIDVCRTLVEAENEYFSTSRDGKPKQYAQKIASEEGKHDGLFWRAAEGEPQSPIGPLMVSAEGEGYRRQGGGSQTPFHGYFYRILSAQGDGAPGGAKNYLVNGEMTGGFAFVAYPAEYESSGVMTFIVNQDGVVFQKDLGEKTGELAGAMKEYAPDSTWQKVE